MGILNIFYKSEEKILKVKNEENLLKLCLNHKIPLNHSCGGMASCGTCRILITKELDSLPKRNVLEQKMTDNRQFKKSERLACQLKITKTSSFQFILPEDADDEFYNDFV